MNKTTVTVESLRFNALNAVMCSLVHKQPMENFFVTEKEDGEEFVYYTGDDYDCGADFFDLFEIYRPVIIPRDDGSWVATKHDTQILYVANNAAVALCKLIIEYEFGSNSVDIPDILLREL